MEEVDALGDRVGILAGSLLGKLNCCVRADVQAVGTPAELRSRHAAYEIHLPVEDVERTLEFLLREFPEVRRSYGTATRISIPGVREDTLGQLLDSLGRAKKTLGLTDMAIHE